VVNQAKNKIRGKKTKNPVELPNSHKFPLKKTKQKVCSDQTYYSPFRVSN